MCLAKCSITLCLDLTWIAWTSTRSWCFPSTGFAQTMAVRLNDKQQLDRTQCLVVNGESSKDTAVRSGVPQGRVLGPLIFIMGFILYINDIDQHASSNIRLFVDDSLLYRVIHSARDAFELQKDREQMCSWDKNWHMLFNVSKCSVLTITKKTIPIKSTYTIGGQALARRGAP